MALKINLYQIFCNLSPLPAGEGIMVLKSTIIGLPAIYPLSPWERARERAKRNNLKKRRLKRWQHKHALPKPPKEKHKKQLLSNTFQTTCSHQNQAHVV